MLTIKQTKRWSDSFETYGETVNYKNLYKNTKEWLSNEKNAYLLTSLSAIGGFVVLIVL